jgi:uncharacterized membrane protein YgcG
MTWLVLGVIVAVVAALAAGLLVISHIASRTPGRAARTGASSDGSDLTFAIPALTGAGASAQKQPGPHDSPGHHDHGGDGGGGDGGGGSD